MNTRAGRRAKIVSTCCAVAGGFGALACSVSMILVTVGLVGAAAAASGSIAGMAAMGSTSSGQTPSNGLFSSTVRLLVQVGPPLLIISIVAIAVSVGIRRRAAALPAMLAGAVMYAGMYLQSSVPLMYASIALGLVVWTAVYFWTRRPLRNLRP